MMGSGMKVSGKMKNIMAKEKRCGQIVHLIKDNILWAKNKARASSSGQMEANILDNSIKII